MHRPLHKTIWHIGLHTIWHIGNISLHMASSLSVQIYTDSTLRQASLPLRSGNQACTGPALECTGPAHGQHFTAHGLEPVRTNLYGRNSLTSRAVFAFTLRRACTYTAQGLQIQFTGPANPIHSLIPKWSPIFPAA